MRENKRAVIKNHDEHKARKHDMQSNKATIPQTAVQ